MRMQWFSEDMKLKVPFLGMSYQFLIIEIWLFQELIVPGEMQYQEDVGSIPTGDEHMNFNYSDFLKSWSWKCHSHSL